MQYGALLTCERLSLALVMEVNHATEAQAALQSDKHIQGPLRNTLNMFRLWPVVWSFVQWH